jgi:hypothetical protein
MQIKRNARSAQFSEDAAYFRRMLSSIRTIGFTIAVARNPHR